MWESVQPRSTITQPVTADVAVEVSADAIVGHLVPAVRAAQVRLQPKDRNWIPAALPGPPDVTARDRRLYLSVSRYATRLSRSSSGRLANEVGIRLAKPSTITAPGSLIDSRM